MMTFGVWRWNAKGGMRFAFPPYGPTTVGFGSLMISGHRGTFSLGLLSTVGSLSVLLAALSVLPALLRLLRERYLANAIAIQPGNLPNRD